jgi:hypothetical protein
MAPTKPATVREAVGLPKPTTLGEAGRAKPKDHLAFVQTVLISG